jgi:hypothetical protein
MIVPLATQFDAVPPSDGLTLSNGAPATLLVRASHRQDGRCHAMYAVMAKPSAAADGFGLWELTPGWENRVVSASTLEQSRGVWHGQLYWTYPTDVGIVMCIVPGGRGIWRLNQQLTPAQQQVAVRAVLPGPAAGTPPPGPQPPLAHLQAIAMAFELQKREPGTFGAAVLRPLQPPNSPPWTAP